MMAQDRNTQHVPVGRKRWTLTVVGLLVIAVVTVLNRGDGDRHDGSNRSQPVSDAGERPNDAETTGSDMSRNGLSTFADSLRFFLDRLGDPDFTETYGDGFTWYIAAEELGLIGLPAIPHLIDRLATDDDYERTQVLYALRLAAQHDNVRSVTGGGYVDLVPDAFPSPEVHAELVAAWREWYAEYFEPSP